MSYFNRINDELQGLKSRFHKHAPLLDCVVSLFVGDVTCSKLDDRLITDGRRRRLLAENESRDRPVGGCSVRPDEKLPPVRRLSND